MKQQKKQNIGLYKIRLLHNNMKKQHRIYENDVNFVPLNKNSYPICQM